MQYTRWEYRTVKLDDDGPGWFHRRVMNFPALDAKLNQIGAEGWELISVIYVEDTDVNTDSVIAFLKRQLP